MSEELFKEMAQSILDGDDEISTELAKKALDEGIESLAAITDGYMPGVNKVGDAFARVMLSYQSLLWLGRL